MTGGEFGFSSNAQQVIDKVVTFLEQEFSNVDFDQQVLETINKLNTQDINTLTNELESNRLSVASSMARLGKRGFLD